MIKVGDSVEWEHQKSSSYGRKTFMARGKVLKIFDSIVGSKVKTKVASIQVSYNKYWKLINHKVTCVSLNKLILVDKIRNKKEDKIFNSTYEELLNKNPKIRERRDNLKKASSIGKIYLEQDPEWKYRKKS